MIYRNSQRSYQEQTFYLKAMNLIFILRAERATKGFQRKNETIRFVLGRLLWHVGIDRTESILKIEIR